MNAFLCVLELREEQERKAPAQRVKQEFSLGWRVYITYMTG